MADDEKREYHRFLALLEVRVLPGDQVPADLKLVTIDIGTGGARSPPIGRSRQTRFSS